MIKSIATVGALALASNASALVLAAPAPADEVEIVFRVVDAPEVEGPIRVTVLELEHQLSADDVITIFLGMVQTWGDTSATPEAVAAQVDWFLVTLAEVAVR